MVRGIFVLALWAATLAPAAAQEDKSHWGVSASFVPRWRVPAEARILFDADKVSVDGSEFRIGLVRGRTLSGDWGVSFVRKTLKDGSRVERGLGRSCFGDFGCVEDGTVYLARQVSLIGVEIHKFIPFGTIKRRVQIGMNVAGGVAQVRGTAERHQFFPNFAEHPQYGYWIGLAQGEEVQEVGARELFLGEVKTLPLGKIEVAVAAILAPGINVPGYEVAAVTFVYLFGAR